jgi:hypothetical protein
MDYFGNRSFTPLVIRPQSGLMDLSEHSFMGNLTNLDIYMPSYHPPPGPAPTSHYDHNMQRHPWVHPVNNNAGPERVD